MKALLSLLRLAGPHRPAMAAAFVGRLIEAVAATLPLAVTLAAALAILAPEPLAGWPAPPPGKPATIALVGALLAGAYGVQFLAFHCASRLGHMAGYRLTALLRLRLVDHLRRLPASFFLARDSGDITAALLADVTRLEMFPGIVLPRLVLGLTFPLAGAGVALWQDWRIGWPLALMVAALPVLMVQSARFQAGASAQAAQAATRLNSRLLDMIHAMPVIKAFGLTARHLAGVTGAIDQARDDGKTLIGAYVAGAILVPVLVGAAGALTVVRAFLADGGDSAFLADGGDTAGLVRLLVFVFLTLRVFAPVIELVEFSSIILQMTQSAERIADILAQPAQEAGSLRSLPARPDIRFDAVSLIHDDGTAALRELSFTAAAGSVTALVGRSGSGKTSAARLISRMFEPTTGRVSIGGIDVRAYCPDTLADLVGVVSQSVVLFSLSVADNIRLGRPDASLDEVIEAARKARCHALISALPQGYDTVLDNGGAALSGGERQRLALARLFLKDCPVLVLDEATSALDVENEHLVQQALATLVAGRTVVMIAHRLWTVRDADHIVVLEDGRVAEQGPHQALFEGGGCYRALWQALAEAPGWRRNSGQI